MMKMLQATGKKGLGYDADDADDVGKPGFGSKVVDRCPVALSICQDRGGKKKEERGTKMSRTSSTKTRWMDGMQ